MSDFFNSRRRKLGTVVLVMACVFMGGWVRSLTITDNVAFATGTSNRDTISSLGSKIVWRSQRQIPLTLVPKSLEWTTEDAIDFGDIADIWDWKLFGFAAHFSSGHTMIVAPYYFFAVPLTLLSAWLLLSTPRKNTQPKNAN